MQRRHLFAAAISLVFLPFSAQSAEFTNYKPGVIQDALDKGETVFVDYSASWCSTCQRQKRVIHALREANPNYDAAMRFVLVDWDEYGQEAVTTDRNIPRRSTLILLRADEELGRIVAGTSEKQIKELMDKGLPTSE